MIEDYLLSEDDDTLSPHVLLMLIVTHGHRLIQRLKGLAVICLSTRVPTVLVDMNTQEMSDGQMPEPGT